MENQSNQEFFNIFYQLKLSQVSDPNSYAETYRQNVISFCSDGIPNLKDRKRVAENAVVGKVERKSEKVVRILTRPKEVNDSDSAELVKGRKTRRDEAKVSAPPEDDELIILGSGSSDEEPDRARPEQFQPEWRPVPRRDHMALPRIPGRQAAASSVTFKICSYNVLCQETIGTTMYLYRHVTKKKPWLDWDHRWARIKTHFTNINADIYCLQEVQGDHYEEYFVPFFRSQGFDGRYKHKTGTKPDGCAIFYRSSKFTLVDYAEVEYLRSATYLDRDNVGQVAVLCPVSRDRAVSDVRLVVANTHLLFNLRRKEIRLAQIAMLLAEVQKRARKAPPPAFRGQGRGNYARQRGMENRSQQSPSSHQEDFHPVVICGDLNSDIDSLVYSLLAGGFARWERKLRLPLGWDDLLPEIIGINRTCNYVSRADILDRWGRPPTVRGSGRSGIARGTGRGTSADKGAKGGGGWDSDDPVEEDAPAGYSGSFWGSNAKSNKVSAGAVASCVDSANDDDAGSSSTTLQDFVRQQAQGGGDLPFGIRSVTNWAPDFPPGPNDPPFGALALDLPLVSVYEHAGGGVPPSEANSAPKSPLLLEPGTDPYEDPKASNDVPQSDWSDWDHFKSSRDVTTHHSRETENVDYLFYSVGFRRFIRSSPSLPDAPFGFRLKSVRESRLRLLQRLSLPMVKHVKSGQLAPLPNDAHGSDHMPLGAEFKLML